ncbi:Arm DNA-binding domain-containing protein [Albibacterium sp.]|uniref:Arm DNA-binding domain-containing protein n=1 Tax=Albibacterium sp. TaxID=2952885 RepID=UPI002C00D300|nr:Arm DNA-binding domain-containing protein [Albibacterium sp.]HUH18402.1 Arm DNA-binding domain-containing protein [Albibacterium sp.]
MDFLLGIRRSQTKNDVAPLYIRVTIDGISKKISLGVKINPKDWDIKSKRVKKTEPSYKVINSKIIQTQVDLDRHFNALQTQVDRVTPDMVKNAYLGRLETKANSEKSEKGKDTILYAFDEFIMRFKKWSIKDSDHMIHSSIDVPPKRRWNHF